MLNRVGEIEDSENYTEEREAAKFPDTQSPLTHVLNLEVGTSRIDRIALGITNFLRQIATPTLLILADFSAILTAGQIALAIRHWAEPAHFQANFYPGLFAYGGLFILAYFATGLYPGIGRSGPEELRRVTLTTTMLTFLLIAITYVTRGRFDYGVSVYLIGWGFALFLVPVFRALIRGIFGRRRWWGRKAIILAHDMSVAEKLVSTLKVRPRLGIKPVAILTSKEDAQRCHGIPQIHGLDQSLKEAKHKGISYAIVTLSDLNDPNGLALIRKYENCFRHWIIAPGFTEGYSLWVRTRDFGGVLGLELSHRLLNKGDQRIKRLLDLLLTSIIGILALPLCLAIAALIKVDSKGPVLYRQTRLGKNGKPFMAYKFRSMVCDADVILQEYLARHPEFRSEWEATQKLKRDPRITRLGVFLRQTSLDELPQLLNVLSGEMSLVGPRPCMPEQVSYYNDVWELYKRVRPGITGQWQISGRNALSFKERTTLDAYYIRNWSVWLDIYILAKTLLVVLQRDGAY